MSCAFWSAQSLDRPSTSEKQFILDTDWSFYKDIDSLLWLQKQYKIIPKRLKKLIHQVSYIWEIKDDFVLSETCDNYKSDNLEKIIQSIPRITNNEETNTIIEKMFINN